MANLLEGLKQRKLPQWTLGYLTGAWVLLQLMEVVTEPLGLSVVFQQNVLAVAAIGLALTVVLAWYHGEKGRQRVSGTELLILAAVLGVGGVALATLSDGGFQEVQIALDDGRVGTSQIPSIAVLPFTNLSADPANDYFSAGLTEEIVSTLSRIDRLDIAARTSSLRFKGSDRDIREIGRALGVKYLLEGGVRKAGDQVRITAQLIDAESGFEVWSEDFDGSLADVFALQEATALQITHALGLELNPEEMAAVQHRYTWNVEAYDAYLRGWGLLESFHVRVDVPEDRLKVARAHFEDALALDPDYALAAAGLSMVESYYVFFGVDAGPDRILKARQLADRALALDAQLPEAHAALAEAQVMASDFLGAIDSFRESLKLDPENAISWCHLAYVCMAQDPPDAATAELAARESIRRHPTYFWAYFQLARALDLQDRYADAVAAIEQAVALNPEFFGNYYFLGELYLKQDDAAAALEMIETSPYAAELLEEPRFAPLVEGRSLEGRS
jgi:serine/threonine-protein kinase